eukprot:770188_1
MDGTPFVSHMTLDEASKFRINDQVDYRDNMGRFVDCIVIEKNGCQLTLRHTKAKTETNRYRLNVLRYSSKKLDQIKKQYQSEIEERNNLCISCADPLTESDYDSNHALMDTHKRWTHGISGAVLRIIFEMCTFGLRNKTILILLQVCIQWVRCVRIYSMCYVELGLICSICI